MKTESINISSQLFDQLYGEIHVHYTDFPVQPVKQLAKPCSRQTWTLLTMICMLNKHRHKLHEDSITLSLSCLK